MKQLIILVATVSIGTMSEVKTRTRMSELRAHLAQIFDQKVQDETNTIIKVVVMPGTPEQPTTLECIYPAATTDHLESLITELLDKNDKIFKV
jgi:hypothetical protein